MKNILFILALSLSFGCKDSNTKFTGNSVVFSSGTSYETYEWNYKNHTYIVIKGNDGISITHAGHCSCNLNQ